MTIDQNNLPTPQASVALGLSPNTLRTWARGRTNRGEQIPPKFIEGQHFFKRSQASNAPLIWRITACRAFLDGLGYVLPPLKCSEAEKGHS